MNSGGLGKKFELKFKQDWQKSFPEGTIDRIYDTTNGFKQISNVADFIAYNYPYIMYLECKSHLGNTWNWSYFTQYDKLLPKASIKGAIAGVILWMIDHDIIVFLPVQEVEKMKADGLKSFNVKMIKEKLYNIIAIPTEKKRTFLEGDYTPLQKLGDDLWIKN